MQNLLYDVQGSIAIVTINRPDKLNALNRQTLLEIEDAVAGAMADATVHAVILTGSGDKAFAAGADVAEFADYSPTEARDLSETGHRIMDSLAQAPKPILASINGFALGGGLELAMACHLRVASPNARLGQPEVNLGLIPGYGGTQRLVEWVGRARALEMLMNGDPIDAATAHHWGLVNRVSASSETLRDESIAFLQRILQRGPIAVAHCLRLSAMAAQGDPEGYRQEIEAFGSLFQQPESKEGITAFLQKRKASFRGA
ncbi:MAG: enoyl-CoA hydratase/isomerase family protein [Bacteroidota bacterium]